MEPMQSTLPRTCTACGGRLIQKSPYICQCESCGRKYYISASRTHKVSVRLSVGKMLLLGSAAVISLIAAAVLGYQLYTGHLVLSAKRFSVAFRDFLMEVYEKPIAEIGEEDLARIKYLKIERENGYQFTYSFQDDYGAPGTAPRESITIKASKDDFSPTNVQYFTGLTQLELYTGAWENYLLPEENVLRSITCTDGLSRYGDSKFFENVNPETLEEVSILEAENLDDFSFLENLKGIRRFSLEKAKIRETDMFGALEHLEELQLHYVEMDEDKAYDLIRGCLELPSLQYFFIEGKSAWYVSDEQWESLEREFGSRVAMVRK